MESVEKLEKLLQEGKITSDEYQELKKNLPEPSKPSNIMERPWQVWVCVGFLVIASILNFVGSLAEPKMFAVVFVSAVLNLAFAIGLYYRQKWAFVISIIFAALSGIATLYKLIFIAAIFNFAFIVILYMVKEYYFPKK